MTQEKMVFKHQPNHWVDRPSIDAITDKRLDPFDRCLLLYMVFRFDYFTDVQKKPYFESTQTLADVFGVHRNTVSRAIQTLKGLGYIELTTNKGGSNTYTKVTTWLNGVLPAGQDKPKAPDVTHMKVIQKQPEVKPTPNFNDHWYGESEDDPF